MVFNNWAMDRGFFCIFLIFVLLYVFPSIIFISIHILATFI